jgi:hypothetical protein
MPWPPGREHLPHNILRDPEQVGQRLQIVREGDNGFPPLRIVDWPSHPGREPDIKSSRRDGIVHGRWNDKAAQVVSRSERKVESPLDSPSQCFVWSPSKNPRTPKRPSSQYYTNGQPFEAGSPRSTMAPHKAGGDRGIGQPQRHPTFNPSARACVVAQAGANAPVGCSLPSV